MLKYTPEQLEAINTIGDNLQIIACAGSGKTQVISQRIVNILKKEKGILPQNIVAFTYTEKAAGELQARILKLCKEWPSFSTIKTFLPEGVLKAAL